MNTEVYPKVACPNRQESLRSRDSPACDWISTTVKYCSSCPSLRAHIWRILTRFSHTAQAVALRVGVGMQR